MSSEAYKSYMAEKFEALYNDIDESVAQLILLRRFFRNAAMVSKGEGIVPDSAKI
ncbi:hypothetical protein KBA27_01525 [bacterium]|nr:hypothetical protein [bacterium]